MPILVADIERVDGTAVGRGLIEFTVTARTDVTSRQFQTFNEWVASVCQIAHDQGLRVEITYNDRLLSRFGRRWKPRIVAVTMLQGTDPCHIS